MSYIHQALKKAQAQRDETMGREEGIPLRPRPARPRLGKRTLIAAALLGMVPLAFVLYSWLDREAARSQGRIPQKVAAADPAPVPEERADVEALYQAGRRHQTGGRSAEAKVLYEQALLADPGHVPSLNNLGVILMAEKAYSEARIRLEKAVRLDPGYADACYNLACLSALTDQPTQGLRYLQRAISLNPKVREWAKIDADLRRLRKEPAFKEMVGE